MHVDSACRSRALRWTGAGRTLATYSEYPPTGPGVTVSAVAVRDVKHTHAVLCSTALNL
jgi:hypothetical protein